MKKRAIAIVLLLFVAGGLLLAYRLWRHSGIKNTNHECIALADNTGQLEIFYDEKSNKPVFIYGAFSETKINNQEDAVKSLNSANEIMGFKNPEREFKCSRVDNVENLVKYRLQQYYDDIPVHGSQIIVSTDNNGKSTALSGDYSSGIDIDTNPKITAAFAGEKVMSLIKGNIKINETELMFYTYKLKSPRLSWRINIEGSDKSGKMIRMNIFIDALTGRAIGIESLFFDATLNANGPDVFNINRSFVVYKPDSDTEKYYMIDREKKISIYGFKEDVPEIIRNNKNEWNNKYAVSAYFNLANVYDYYKTVLGRDSMDGKGGDIACFVNVPLDVTENNPACLCEVGNQYGILITDGTGEFQNIPGALDVLAHEYTHGVVNCVSGLVNKNESGAIHEAYADIIGNLIENKNDNEWLIAEDSMRDPGKKRALRNMSNPGEFQQPDRVGGRFYKKTDGIFGNLGLQKDNGHVHTNCGVLNKAAYLMWKNGIKDKEKLARLWYQSMFSLSPYSGFIACRLAVTLAAIEMKMSVEEMEIIANAFYEVGIGERYAKETMPPERSETPAATSGTSDAVSVTRPALKENRKDNVEVTAETAAETAAETTTETTVETTAETTTETTVETTAEKSRQTEPTTETTEHAEAVKGRGNTTGNIVNCGLVAEQDEWVYFSNIKDGGKLYKMKTDGSEKIKLTVNKAFYINVLGDWIYYQDDDGKYTSINKLNVKDGSKTVIYNDTAYYISVGDGWIYYVDGDMKPHKIKPDGSNKTKISDDSAYDMNVQEEWIYYSNSNDKMKPYKIKVNGADRTKICDDSAYSLVVSGDWLYYIKPSLVWTSGNVCRIKTDGTEKTDLSGGLKDNITAYNHLNVDGEWVYFNFYDLSFPTNVYLVKMGVDGSSAEVLRECGWAYDYINVTDAHIYYTDMTLSREFYRANKEGTEIVKIR